MRLKYSKWKIQIPSKVEAFNLLKFKLHHIYIYTLRMESLANRSGHFEVHPPFWLKVI